MEYQPAFVKTVIYLMAVKTWVKDYGTFITAMIAILWTAYNTYTQAKREREFKAGEWLRQMRMPRYVAFVRAADEFEDAILYAYAEHEPEIHGPMPKEVPDFNITSREFRHQLSEVTLLGPPEVAVAAKLVQYSLWEWMRRLEENPTAWDQSIANKTLDDFIATARKVLDVEGKGAQALVFPGYQEWRKSALKRD